MIHYDLGPSEGRPRDKYKNLKYYFIVAVLTGLIFMGITGYWYFKRTDEVTKEDVTTLHNLVIAEPVQHFRVGSRKRGTRFFAFKFKGWKNEFRFDDNFYIYTWPYMIYVNYRVGDTVSVQIVGDQTGKVIDMVNVTYKGRFIVDFERRNASMHRGASLLFKFSIIFSLIMIGVGMVWYAIQFFK